jgi:hypothetical protein
VYWRVTPLRSGNHQLVVGAGDRQLDIPFSSGSESKSGKSEYVSGTLEPLLFGVGKLPGTAPGGLVEFAVEYPASSYSVMGIEVSWVTVFLVVSFISALLIVKRLDVSF